MVVVAVLVAVAAVDSRDRTVDEPFGWPENWTAGIEE